jgi:hypothetical protein
MQVEVSCVDDSFLDDLESLSRYSHAVVRSFSVGSSPAGVDRLSADVDLSSKQAHVGRRYRLGAVLLVGTGRARATYHGVTIVRLCPALYVHGVVLQESDG